MCSGSAARAASAPRATSTSAWCAPTSPSDPAALAPLDREDQVEELAAAGNPELAVELRQVVLHRLLADPQQAGDLQVGQALEHVEHHLPLALGDRHGAHAQLEDLLDGRRLPALLEQLGDHIGELLGGERLLHQVVDAEVE